MRHGTNPRLVTDDGNLIAVDLSADFCSEHEWGIAGIRGALGIGADPKAVGLDARRATEVPKTLLYKKLDDGAALGLLSEWTAEREPESFPDRQLGGLRGRDLVAAWDESTFGIRVATALVPALEQLHAAFKALDVAVWLGGHRGLLENAGLMLAIVSRVPEQHAQAMREADADHAALKAAATATGIEAELRAAGLRWFALSPRWADAKKRSVKFWLNPYQQDIHEAGWFTVKELRQWKQGKGPVMKAARRRA